MWAHGQLMGWLAFGAGLILGFFVAGLACVARRSDDNAKRAFEKWRNDR